MFSWILNATIVTMILTTIFAFAVTTVATTGADNASVTALSASPIPTSSESKCQIAGSAIQAVAATRPIPLSNFTAYMDAHDPFVRGCVTPVSIFSAACIILNLVSDVVASV